MKKKKLSLKKIIVSSLTEGESKKIFGGETLQCNTAGPDCSEAICTGACSNACTATCPTNYQCGPTEEDACFPSGPAACPSAQCPPDTLMECPSGLCQVSVRGYTCV